MNKTDYHLFNLILSPTCMLCMCIGVLLSAHVPFIVAPYLVYWDSIFRWFCLTGYFLNCDLIIFCLGCLNRNVFSSVAYSLKKSGRA